MSLHLLREGRPLLAVSGSSRRPSREGKEDWGSLSRLSPPVPGPHGGRVGTRGPALPATPSKQSVSVRPARNRRTSCNRGRGWAWLTVLRPLGAAVQRRLRENGGLDPGPWSYNDATRITPSVASVTMDIEQVEMKSAQARDERLSNSLLNPTACNSELARWNTGSDFNNGAEVTRSKIPPLAKPGSCRQQPRCAARPQQQPTRFQTPSMAVSCETSPELITMRSNSLRSANLRT